MGETAKAHSRRVRDGFFSSFVKGRIIDIGCGDDPLTNSCVRWDMEEGDATLLMGVIDGSYDTVYSSHCLEHLELPAVALKNWWRVLAKHGHLILFVPHKFLYEQRTALPSRWNSAYHKQFFTIGEEGNGSIGLLPLVQRTLPEARLIYVKECSEGFAFLSSDHPIGEYSIEMVLYKE